MRMLAVVLVISMGIIHTCAAKKVLMIAAQQVSHVMEQAAVAEALMARGHSVHMLLQDSFPKLDSVKGKGIEAVEFPPGSVDVNVFIKELQDNIFAKDFDNAKLIANIIGAMKEQCSDILHDRKVMGTLVGEKYDLALVDGMFFTPCLFLIAHNISVPFVYMFSSPLDLSLGIPTLPSANVATYARHASSMNLWQKIKNIGQLLLQAFLMYKSEAPDLVAKFAPQETSLLGISKKSLLFIITKDHMLEGPSVSLPNVVRVPGVTLSKGNPLPKDINDVIESTSHGVIIVSFGSTVDTFPQDIFIKFIQGFSAVKSTVIFRVSKELVANPGTHVPDNVKLLSWLPQQDILAHPNTKLFITHCGNNGQYEAVYHGVPMIGFPMFAEQPHNCMRMVDKGLGTCMDIQAFTTEELIDNINMVMDNVEYGKKAKRLSAIMHSQRAPSEIIADHIEHVMEFGGEHLRSVSHDMPLYELLMLDIVVLMLGVLLIVCYILKRIIFFVIGKFTSSESKKEKPE